MMIRLLIFLWLFSAMANAQTTVGLTLTNNPSGLVGWWTFDGPDVTWTSSTAGSCIDRSGNANTGTFTGMGRATNCVAGRHGQGFVFSGASDLVNCGSGTSLDDLTNGFTITWWYNGVPYATGVRYIAVKSSSSGWRVQKSTGNQILFARDGSTDLSATFSAQLRTNVWQHFAVVWDGPSMASNSVSLYRDGLYVYKTAGVDGAAPVSDAANSVTLGGVGGDSTFSDRLDDVRIFNRALSAGEVALIYNSSTPFVGLIPAVAATNLADAFIDFEGTNDGTTVDALIMTNATHGAWSNRQWTMPASVSNFWISSAGACDTFSTYNVSNTLYRSGGTNGLAHLRQYVSSESITLSVPAGISNLTGGFLFKCGILQKTTANGHDIFTINTAGGANSGVCQWNPNTPGMAAHTTSNGTSYAGIYILQAPEVWYDYEWHWKAGVSSGFYLTVFSTTNWPTPLTRWKAVGSSFSPSASTNIASISIGDNGHGDLEQATNYYDNLRFDFSVAQHPLGP